MPVRIIGIGDLTVDNLLPELERIPDWGQEVEISEPTRRLGGNIGNMAVGASALHSDFVSFGWIGDDAEGDFILSAFRELQLPVEGLLRLHGGRTSQAFAGIRKDGERFFLTYTGVLSRMEQLILENPLPWGEIVFLSGWCFPPRIKKEILIRKIIEWQNEGRLVAADLIWSDRTWEVFDDLVEVLRYLDLLFLNEDELKAAAKTDDTNDGMRELRERLQWNSDTKNKILIVKQGKRGACSMSNEGVFQSPTLPVKLKNTVGAGDLFNLAYLHAKWNMGCDLQKALEFACVFVPLLIGNNISHPPDEEDVLRIIREMRN